MNLHDVEVIEGCVEGFDVDEADYYTSIHRAINSGSAWSFQGSYGRAMMDAIKSGSCMLGEKPARDYWGNFIPSRSMVQEGTKGSRGYVAAARGGDWVEMLEAA